MVNLILYTKTLAFHLSLYFSIVYGGLETRFALKSLEEFVLSKCNKTIPPFHYNETVIDVELRYSPLLVLDLDSANEELKVSSYIHVLWKDEGLTWKPEDYGNHKYLEIDPGEIWTPKLSIFNSVDNLQALGKQTPVITGYTGLSELLMNDVIRTRCKINVSKFPFDHQTCDIIFVPVYGYNIRLKIGEPNLGNINVSSANGEWSLEGTEHTIVDLGNVGLQTAKFTLKLRRKTMYYCINIIFPMVLLSALTPFVFLIPVRSGEKLTFLMSIFVSHAMFLNLIHQIIPSTSDAVSTLAVFLVLIELQGFLTILATIIVLCVHDRQGKKDTESQDRKRNKDTGAHDLKRNGQSGTSRRDAINETVMTTEVKSGPRGSICGREQPESMLDKVFFVLSMILFVAGGCIWLFSF